MKSVILTNNIFSAQVSVCIYIEHTVIDSCCLIRVIGYCVVEFTAVDLVRIELFCNGFNRITVYKSKVIFQILSSAVLIDTVIAGLVFFKQGFISIIIC